MIGGVVMFAVLESGADRVILEGNGIGTSTQRQATMMIDLFTQTVRPAPELFYGRGDANDPRLGEVVASIESAYPQTECVILGCPQDEGVRRNRGRIGAAEAPAEIRRAFYRLTPFGIRAEILFDLGDTIIQPSLEETHDLHRSVVRQLLQDGKVVISLGGGNDVSYPDCAALADIFPDPLAFNIDAHFDVRADPERNSGTPYRQLLDEGLIAPEKFYELGYQPAVNSAIYFDDLKRRGVQIISLADLQAFGALNKVEEILAMENATAIFWGFDIDAVRASDAPGVSAPAPIGLTGDELCALAYLAGRTPATRIIEFSELNPRHDIDGRTSRLVALAIHSFLIGRNWRLNA
jgi:formiminoglutamase